MLALLIGVIFAGCSQQTTSTTSVTVPTTVVCNYSKIEVYFYYSPSCPHCEKVKPYIDELREKYKDVTFYYCNVQDKNISKVCYKYAYYVIGVPTVVVHAGNVTTALIGERDIMGVEDLIRSLSCCER